jgi:hypothetical protein
VSPDPFATASAGIRGRPLAEGRSVASRLADQAGRSWAGKALLLAFSSRSGTGRANVGARALLASAGLPQRSASGGLAMKGWVELGGQLVA